MTPSTQRLIYRSNELTRLYREVRYQYATQPHTETGDALYFRVLRDHTEAKRAAAMALAEEAGLESAGPDPRLAGIVHRTHNGELQRSIDGGRTWFNH